MQAAVTLVLTVFYLVISNSVVSGFVPTCNMSQMGTLWPNYQDPTKFWQCLQINTPPNLRICATFGHWFSYFHQQCVDPEYWIEPPEQPAGGDGYVPRCTQEEMGRLLPNYNDLRRFWQCLALGQPPQDRQCAYANDWFSYYHQQCVHPDYWIQPPNPPQK